jgi:hypothetical protein
MIERNGSQHWVQSFIICRITIVTIQNIDHIITKKGLKRASTVTVSFIETAILSGHCEYLLKLIISNRNKKSFKYPFF